MKARFTTFIRRNLRWASRYVTVIKFGLVGVLNTAVDYCVSSIVFYLLRREEWLSTAVGYVCGCVCSFLLNGRFTFKARGRVWQFIAVSAVSLTAGAALTQYLPVQYWLAKAVAIVVTFSINYVGYRRFVYRRTNDS